MNDPGRARLARAPATVVHPHRKAHTMKASELITQLQDAIATHGDLLVVDIRNRGVEVHAVEYQAQDDVDPDYPEFRETFYVW